MPHNKSKYKPIGLDSGASKCSCSRTFKYKSERDPNMKLQLYHKVCTKLLESFEKVSEPEKAITLKEVQQDEVERVKRT